VSPVPTVFTTGFIGCTSISGRLEVFRAVGLGFGSGLSNGSSAGLAGVLTRRGRLDCAKTIPHRTTRDRLSEKGDRRDD